MMSIVRLAAIARNYEKAIAEITPWCKAIATGLGYQSIGGIELSTTGISVEFFLCYNDYDKFFFTFADLGKEPSVIIARIQEERKKEQERRKKEHKEEERKIYERLKDKYENSDT